jgi:hypothetical protein
MSVILTQRMTMQMHVLAAVMVVSMHMPAFSDQSHPEYSAEENEHRANAELGCYRKRFRNRHTDHQYHCPDQQ